MLCRQPVIPGNSSGFVRRPIDNEPQGGQHERVRAMFGRYLAGELPSDILVGHSRHPFLQCSSPSFLDLKSPSVDSAKPLQRNRPPQPVIGVLGGIGSGKSSVAHAVRDGFVIDADRIGHELLSVPRIRKAIADLFGPAVLTSEGEVDRVRLADLVFSESESSAINRARLEAVLHPEIRNEVQRQLKSVDPEKTCVLIDAALLLEAGWQKDCDALVFVDTPLSVRRQRVMQNRNWTETELTRRENAQLSVKHKKELADLVVDNAGSVAAAAVQIDSWLRASRAKFLQKPTAPSPSLSLFE